MTPAIVERILFDFSTVPGDDGWQILNDGVMGGVSSSRFEIIGGLAVFQGTVSLANNGGFASVRSPLIPPRLCGCDTFVLRVRGDGHRYKFTVRMQSSFDSAIYQSVFAPAPAAWEELRLPFADFVPTFRGRTLTGEPPLDSAGIVSVGFLISEKQAGPFRLEIAWIQAVGR